MLKMTRSGNETEAGGGADWRQWLEADGMLSPGWRESYRRTLEGFEQFCRKRAGAQPPSAGASASASPSVGLAREYVELQRLERAPGPAQLQEWQDALNWRFRCRRGQRSAALTGVPPLGRADLGRTAWERRLVETMRVRHLPWRTEQTYRGWESEARWIHSEGLTCFCGLDSGLLANPKGQNRCCRRLRCRLTHCATGIYLLLAALPARRLRPAGGVQRTCVTH